MLARPARDHQSQLMTTPRLTVVAGHERIRVGDDVLRVVFEAPVIVHFGWNDRTEFFPDFAILPKALFMGF
jgi:hypothetical protein